MKILKQLNNFSNKFTTFYLRLFRLKFRPSYGVFRALTRYISLCKWVYPQFNTWDRYTKTPGLTPKFKLIPWFLLSTLVIFVNFSFFYIGVGQILTRNAELTSTHVMILILYTSSASAASSAILSFVLEGDGISFMLANLQIIRKDSLDPVGMENGVIPVNRKANAQIVHFTDDPSDLIGLFSHLLLLFPFQIPVTTCAIILLSGDIDPTYFWFKDFTISSHLKLFLRCTIIGVANIHGTLVMADILISIANVIQATRNGFKRMSPPKLWQGRYEFNFKMSHVLTKLGKSAKFPKFLSKYRQLSILTRVTNQASYYVVPVAIFIGLFNCIICAYFVIRLSSTLPVLLLICSILIITMVVVAAHGCFPVLADVTLEGKRVIELWKLEERSSYKKRQLKSCRPLGIWIGPFFMMGKYTRRTYLELVLSYTFSLIVSV